LTQVHVLANQSTFFYIYRSKQLGSKLNQSISSSLN